MARVGFKTAIAADTFSSSTLTQLFGQLRAALVEAGFTVNIDTATTLDVSRTGTPPGAGDDDTPHWAFTLADNGSIRALTAHSVYGATLHSAGALSHQRSLIYATAQPAQMPDLTLWFAADGGAGWWWVHVNVADPTSPSGGSFGAGCAGVTTRRYSSDLHQGLCARYGLRTLNGDWFPVYARDERGERIIGPWTTSWSPLGMGLSHNGKRHAGSSLPRLAVPQFPAKEGGITACILGEYNEVMMLTDGYTHEERVLPGWMALVGNADNPPYAALAPEVFEVF